MKKKHTHKTKVAKVPQHDSLADIQKLKDEFTAQEAAVMANLIQQTPMGASMAFFDPEKDVANIEAITENTENNIPEKNKIAKRKKKE
jgi:hypothetical protein